MGEYITSHLTSTRHSTLFVRTNELYYMFMKLQGPSRGWLISGFLGGAIFGLIFILLGAPKT